MLSAALGRRVNETYLPDCPTCHKCHTDFGDSFYSFCLIFTIYISIPYDLNTAFSALLLLLFYLLCIIINFSIN